MKPLRSSISDQKALTGETQQGEGVGRRSFLRGGLLVGAATVGLTVASSAAFTNQALAAGRQANWHWCQYCAQIWYFEPNGGYGECASPTGYHNAGTTDYFFDYNESTPYSSQSGWAFCAICHVMFYGPNINVSSCALGVNYDGKLPYGPHTFYDSSTSYDVATASYSSWQNGWNYCVKCRALFHGSGHAAGWCPYDHGQHSPYASSYWVGHN